MVRENLEDSIFVMDPSRHETINAALTPGGFGIGGHKVDITSQDCLCKIEEIKSNRTPDISTTELIYFVRMDSSGAPYDPWGIDEGRSAKLNKHKGAENWRHQRVVFAVFEQYLAFLRTHNKAHLVNAQRTHR